jgi:acyl-coenzyme A thioesterase PaaI-like protein
MAELLTGTTLAARAADVLKVPLQAALGARLIDPADPTAGAWFAVEGLASNGRGGLHAAALGTMFEVAAYLALLPELTVAEHAVTHAIATQLIAAAREGERVEVRGTVDRRTRRLAFLSVTAAAGGRTIARSQLTKSIIEAR